jgi:glutathione S-transferase
MLELYQAEWCPSSRRVRARLTELGVDWVARHVEAEADDRARLRERTGASTIPVLVTEDGEAIAGDRDILAWLGEHYEEPPEARRHRAQARAHGLADI